MLSFDDCLDLLDYWLSTDHHITVLTEAEMKRIENDILTTFKDTINKCEILLSRTKCIKEKTILNSAIQRISDLCIELTAKDAKDGPSHNKRSSMKDISLMTEAPIEHKSVARSGSMPDHVSTENGEESIV